MKKIIFLKLGGSLITDKTKPYTAKEEIIAILAKQIKEALDEKSDLRLVIGNGAGSFGHYEATNNPTNSGIKSNGEKIGFCVIQDSVARLNRIIIKHLLSAGVKAIGINPSSIIIGSQGKVREFFIKPICHLINLGIVPVLFGDIVSDEIKGAAIFSTEQILKELAIRFSEQKINIDKIIHNGITAGVIDQEKKVIDKIAIASWQNIKKHIYKTNGFDVTGGMKHKIEESLTLSKYGIKSLIINGVHQKDLLKNALLGKKVIGTLIE